MSRRLDDGAWMGRALELARRGVGLTSPNPPVGALVVRRGSRVGEGFHAKAGEDHAEIRALKQAGKLARGATLYVTLEPCCHFGRTPPCVEAIIAAGISRVVAAVADPNPHVRGRGLKGLRNAGVDVVTGVMAAHGRKLIEPFSFFVRNRLPFVILKLAASADGRIATGSGESKWITGVEARKRARRMRAEVDAIMVGAGTIVKDNPRLTTRIRGKRDPLRVVVDGKLRVRPIARVFLGGASGKTLIVTDSRVAAKRARPFQRRGISIMALPARRGRVSMKEMMRKLAAMGVVSLMVEGGSELAGELVRQRLVHKLMLFLAPRLLGGDGRAMIGSLGVNSIAGSPRLTATEVSRVGEDLLLEGYLKY